MTSSFFFSFFFFKGILAFAGEVFVSRFHGSETINCGLEKSRPCKFLHQAVAHSQAGDIINIDGTGTTRDPYPCESTTVEFQAAGLSLRSYNNRATIACEKHILGFSCVRKNNSPIVIALEGITFLGTGLRLVDCALRMKNVYFFNSFFDALSINLALRMQRKIELIGCLFKMNEAKGVTINGDEVQIEIKNTTFENNKIQNKYHALLDVSGLSPQSKITVNLTDINAVNNTCAGKACFVLSSGNNSGLLILSMQKGNFENNQAGETVLDIRGNSNIEFKSVLFSENNGRAINIAGGNSVEYKLIYGNFVRNNILKVKAAGEGGAILVSGFKQRAFVFISRSNFTSNRGHDGGAFAILDIVSKIVNVNIERCNFADNRAQGSGGAVTIGTKHNWQIGGFVTIQNSNFIGNKLNQGGELDNETATRDSGGGGALALYVQYMANFTLINNSFVDNIAKYRSSGAVRANFITLLSETVIQCCEFLRNKGSGYSGTFELTSTAKKFSAHPRRVSIRNSTFKENKAIGIAFQDVHLYHGYVTMSFCNFEGNSAGGILLAVPSKQCDLRVENSALIDNKYFEFDVSINNCSGGNFTVTNTLITRNNCTTKNRMFRVFLNFMNSLVLQSSQFVDNFCFSGVIQVYVPHEISNPANPIRTEVFLNDTVFRGNSGVTKTSLEIWEVARVVIHNCTFVDNYGGLDGSHLRVQLSSSALYVNQSVFKQTEKSQVLHVSKDKPYNGFLTVTSYGDVYMQDTSFICDTFSWGGKVLILVKGARKVHLKNSVKIQAPEGSKLYFHNFTHLEDIEEAHWITSFSMSYYPCPIGYYSIRRGKSTGFAIGDQIECRICPIGANCSTTLSARPNFWGYPISGQGQVRFKLCPQGYCCPTVNQTCRYRNESYRDSGCQGNRTGFLCGRCKKGFSETLFHNRCHPIKDCKDYWYLPLVFICALLFALYLIQKPPLFQRLMRNLTWFLPNKKEKFEPQAFDTEENKATTGPSTTASYGFLKILFYFYQIAGLLTASSYGVSGVLRKTMILPLVSLLDFKLYAESDWNICPFPGMTPLSKTASQLVVTMVIHVSIVLIYWLHTVINMLQKRSPVLPDSAPYLAATLETLLLGYSAVLGTTVRLLDCTTIQHQRRWYYNAEVTCLQWWQKAAKVVYVLHLFPFVITLFIGSIRLYRRQISAKLFLLACFLPLPFLFILSFSHLLRKVKSQEIESRRSELQGSTKYSSICSLESSVFKVLSAPFCDTTTVENSSCKVYWESILIGRRFALISIGSFVTHALLRSVLLAVLCLVFLLHHLSNNPFANFYANLAETVSLASLVVIAILNVGMASFYSAGAPPQGIQYEYVQGFRLTEAIILSVVPFFFVAFMFLSLASQVVRAALFVFQMARRRLGKSKISNSKTRNSNHHSDSKEPLLSPMY